MKNCDFRIKITRTYAYSKEVVNDTRELNTTKNINTGLSQSNDG